MIDIFPHSMVLHRVPVLIHVYAYLQDYFHKGSEVKMTLGKNSRYGGGQGTRKYEKLVESIHAWRFLSKYCIGIIDSYETTYELSINRYFKERCQLISEEHFYLK